MNINHICINCMKEKPQADMVCPHCSFDEKTNPQPLVYLDYWTILRGQYLVGKCMGQGGFGITYMGFDMNLEMKVAIKEYFPCGYAYRRHDVSDNVSVVAPGYEAFFDQEKNTFIEEARILAMCNELPGIVKVKDYFQENGTCYIVMEFLEGVTLKDHVKRSGGNLSSETVFRMMEPVIRSMIQIHEHGVIHKDISPDNIMLTDNKKVKLIDFGAAQRRENIDQAAISAYKERFSPPEQRSEKGVVGTYSDIYAFCATMYYCMVGYAPDDALDRMHDETIQKPSEFGVSISPIREAALMKGLELQPEDRICDAKDLYFLLYMYGQNNGGADKMKQGIAKRKQKKWTIAAVFIICLTIFGHFILQDIGQVKVQREKLSLYADMTVAEKTQLEDDFVKEAISAHEAYGALSADALLKEKANAVATILGERSPGTIGWNALYQDAVKQVYEEYPEEVFCWMIIPITKETDAANVLKQGLSDENNRKVFEQCSKIGISTVYNEDGYLFYIVLMK